MRKLLLFLILTITVIHAETSQKYTEMVPMRDGTRLATDIYRPAQPLVTPVILFRTPYNKDIDPIINPTVIALLNIWGYALVAQDCRGRYASEGQDSLFFSDGWSANQDGYDTIDWIVKQDWCNGKVAIFGASATGITTYRAAGALHPNLLCAMAVVAPTDFYRQVVYPGGEFRKALCERWIRGQGSDYLIDFILQFPYYEHTWQMMNLHTRTALITIPIIHVGGWYDCFSEGSVAAFRDLSKQPQAGMQKLIMGPWIHHTTGTDAKVGDVSYPNAKFDLNILVLKWFNFWLQNGIDEFSQMPDVTYYLMGDADAIDEPGCEWIQSDAWPPAEVSDQILYLAGDKLDLYELLDSLNLTFQFNPDDPVPTIGGNNLEIEAGPFDQSLLNDRTDMLHFTSDVLQTPVRVEGYVKAKLYFSSDRLDTDFTCKLIDVYPDGRQILVTDGIKRARFRQGYEAEDEKLIVPDTIDSLEIVLPPTAIVFNSGHRLKIGISSSNYPRFEVNPNTGAAPNDRSNRKIAYNTLYMGGTYASYVSLPVYEEGTQVAASSHIQPSKFVLSNYPNPFNNTTRIYYHLPEPGDITINIFNVRGQPVKHLFRGRLGRGEHHLTWDGTNDQNVIVSSGLYWCQLHTGNALVYEKMMFLK